VSDTPQTPRAKEPFVIAVLVLVVAGLVFAGIALNNVAGKNSASGVPTPQATPVQPTPPGTSPSTSTTSSTGPIAYADCTAATFGPALAPLNAPADIHKYSAAPAQTIDTSKLYEATITTAKGTIVICLQPELAPVTVNNFVTLARNHFYDGLKFHRVEAAFVIQGGDPKGDGTGGPGFQFNDEKVRQSYVEGAVAMANSGQNTNGSQFFVCIADDSTKLQALYNLFGKVASGMDVAKTIAVGDVMTTVTVAEQQ
jgi:peptidyl-prolyl cis-trans isomerase B (cyclophilin B)